MRRKSIAISLLAILAIVTTGPITGIAETQRRAPHRRAARSYKGPVYSYHRVPRVYPVPTVGLRFGFDYYPRYGMYYGPNYGPFYPYPARYRGTRSYSRSAIRTKVKPVETEVYLNGYYAGVVDDFDGVFQRLHVAPGEHQLELRLEGHRSLTERIYVGPGDTFDLEHIMDPLGPADEAVSGRQPRRIR